MHSSTRTDIRMPQNAVVSDIKQGHLLPCYLLYGEDAFLIRQTLDKIINHILPDEDRVLNLFFMDGDIDIDELCQSLLMPPLIAGRKVVVLRNTRFFRSETVSAPELIDNIINLIETNPQKAAREFLHFLRITGWDLEDMKDEGWRGIRDDDWQKATGNDAGSNREEWLPGIIDLCINSPIKEEPNIESADRLSAILKNGLPEGNHLVLTAASADKRKKLFKTVSDIGKVLYFPQARNESSKKQILTDTLKDLLAAEEKSITPGAWIAIGRKTGFVAEHSVDAVEKLILYTGEKRVISENDVEELIEKTKEGTIFDLTNALSEKKLIPALAALKDLLDQGAHHLMILSMLAREIRFLLHAGMLIRGSMFRSFNHKADYSKFQKDVYPLIRTWMSDAGNKEEGGELIRQNPYVIYLVLKNSRRFDLDVLADHLGELVRMDTWMKSSAKDPGFLLEQFVIRVCSS